MASRYSAYALGLEKYVRDTWCEENCPADLDLKANPITWLGLEIAEVEYVARGRSGGAGAFRLHELSRFVKREGRWLYLDGDCFEK